MNTTELLCKLSDACSASDISLADSIAEEALAKFCNVTRLDDGTVCGFFDNKSEKTILLEAHIDEVAFIVTDVSIDGFVSVAKVGGIDDRLLPAQRVTVFGDKRYSGTFCSTPPHLSGGDKCPKKIDELCIDCGITDAKAHIPLGSLAFYASKAEPLGKNRVCGKALDNRAGVAALLKTAELLCGKELGCNVVIAFTKAEEIGCRGAVTTAYNLPVSAAIAVDTTFGDLPGISPHLTGDLGRGALIGRSPSLSREMTDILLDSASELKLPYQHEVMGGRTGTTADVISVTAGGIKTALISIPIRNMHSPYEVADIRDIDSCAEIVGKAVCEWGNRVD